MDYANPKGMEVRTVSDVVQAGAPARLVGGARVFRARRHEVWDALSRAERLPKWFLPITGDLKLGGRYQLEGNAGGEITRCDPETALEVTWEFAGNTSWLALELTEEAGGTRLALSHVMAKDPDSEAHWINYGPGATGVGWDLSYLGLGLHLDNGGGVIDQNANEAWMGSPDGKAFIRGCADAWCEAHIANGEVAQTARGMAKRTGEAYAP